MTTLNVEIISPNGALFQGECHLVVVPSVSGDIGIMHSHEAVIATLREGKIEIFDDKESLVKSFDVKSGFAEMRDLDKLVILVD